MRIYMYSPLCKPAKLEACFQQECTTTFYGPWVAHSMVPGRSVCQLGFAKNPAIQHADGCAHKAACLRNHMGPSVALGQFWTTKIRMVGSQLTCFQRADFAVLDCWLEYWLELKQEFSAVFAAKKLEVPKELL